MMHLKKNQETFVPVSGFEPISPTFCGRSTVKLFLPGLRWRRKMFVFVAASFLVFCYVLFIGLVSAL